MDLALMFLAIALLATWARLMLPPQEDR